MRIRPATLSDINSIAQVHIEVWKSTYKGILPTKYVEKQNLQKRKQFWENILKLKKKKENRHVVLLLENDQQEVVGFAAAGVPFNFKTKYDSELYAIYILKKYQRKGNGTKLFYKILSQLSEFGLKNMVTFSLRENRFSDFFITRQGIPSEFYQRKILENYFGYLGYTWNDLASFLETIPKNIQHSILPHSDFSKKNDIKESIK